MFGSLRTLLAAAAFISGLSASTYAQSLTTGVLTGTALDQQDRALPGAAVTAVHQPTGSRYETVTDGAGYFQIQGLRVGGPYTVTTSLDGFAERSQSGIFVGLGEARAVVFHLGLAGLRETVTVRGAAASEIDDARAGTAANILPDVVSSVPTIQRSIIDIAQISPYVNALVAPVAGGDATFSIGGKNNRSWSAGSKSKRWWKCNST